MLRGSVTYYRDMSRCDYFGEEVANNLIAVGWLTSSEPIEQGAVPTSFFEKLKALSLEPWQPVVFLGGHHCEICQFDRPSGHLNLFVPNGESIYVAPELISHYIAAHFYRPPQEFIEAVMQCSDTRSMDYKKSILASGGRGLVSPRE